MLTESASRPAAHSSVLHPHQDPHKELANCALLIPRYAKIAVGPGSYPDYVSRVNHTLLSKRPASAKTLQGDPTRDREPVDHCSFHDPGSITAVAGSSGLRRASSLPGSTRRACSSGGSR